VTQRRPAPRAVPRAGSAPWRTVADVASAATGVVPSELAAALRVELDEVERLVTSVERSAACGSSPGLPDGVHALVALVAARLGEQWQPRQLVDVAAAVELAYRATQHHDAVREANGGGRPDSARHRRRNQRVVLDGDWSITQAAVLVAEVGPAAYRLLVRGYGAAQVSRLSGASSVGGGELLRTAAALGALVAGVRSTVGREPSAAEAVLAWAVDGATEATGPVSRAAAR
jgi:hypothetical protein